MPFDQFVIDQMAGDLRPRASVEQKIATGFHRNTQINQEGGIDVEQFRIESIVDRVNTTGTVFLGLTVGCAQCHDHKYDPISLREYYQLFAFLNNVDEPDLELASDEAMAARDRIVAEIEAFHQDLARRHPDLDERERTWEATVDLAFKQAQGAVARVAFDTTRTSRTKEQKRALIELMLARDASFRNDHAILSRLRAREPQFVTTMVVQERAKDPRPTHVHLGGDFTRKGDLVAPGVPAVFPPLADQSPGTPASRMDLARWLVDQRNPLTARVAVNRIWQADFGRGLVETDNDFGTQGSPPSHPELLDWLACEFMESGWNVKHIHRLIVTSAAYRQASRVRPEGQAVDPDNRLLWRQARLRLDAELIRDSALACSGLLSRKLGGPSVFPPQPDGVMTLGQMKREWKADTGADRYRRGVYTFFWRATPFPFLTTFDAPGSQQACTRRMRSNTPLQALTLLNDPAMVEIAKWLPAGLCGKRFPRRIAGLRSSTPSSSVWGESRPDSELVRSHAIVRGREPAGEPRFPPGSYSVADPRLVGRFARPVQPRRVRHPRVTRELAAMTREENRQQALSSMLHAQTRRHFFERCGVGLGAMALARFFDRDGLAAGSSSRDGESAGRPRRPRARPGKKRHLPVHGRRPQPARALRLQAGAAEVHEPADPRFLHQGTAIRIHGHFYKRASQAAGHVAPVRPPRRLGAWVSECLPHLAGVVDDLAFVRSVATDVFNHAPAKLFANTGSSQFGRPSMGAWVTYGIGSESDSLPGFVVLQSGPRGPRGGAVNWGSGFLPSAYQGVPLRSGGEPILNLATPSGFSAASQQRTIATIAELNRARLEVTADPEIATRIAAYEIAYRMQSSAPELIDLKSETPGDAADVRRRAGPALVREQLPAGAAAGGARGSLRPALSHRLGPSRRPRPDID